jgi:hypothetical protein
MGLELVPVAGEELEISWVLVVEEGGEAGPWDEGVNTQPPAKLARNINDVTADARCHLLVFTFVQCNI